MFSFNIKTLFITGGAKLLMKYSGQIKMNSLKSICLGVAKFSKQCITNNKEYLLISIEKPFFIAKKNFKLKCFYLKYFNFLDESK